MGREERASEHAVDRMDGGALVGLCVVLCGVCMRSQIDTAMDNIARALVKTGTGYRYVTLRHATSMPSFLMISLRRSSRCTWRALLGNPHEGPCAFAVRNQFKVCFFTTKIRGQTQRSSVA